MRIGEEHHRMASELHDLLRQVQNPNLHGVDRKLTFRVEQLERAAGPAAALARSR
jgi:hypothetical protein